MIQVLGVNAIFPHARQKAAFTCGVSRVVDVTAKASNSDEIPILKNQPFLSWAASEVRAIRFSAPHPSPVVARIR